MDELTKKAVERLEADMRRYVYDTFPERRIQCLQAFRERMGQKPWETKDD